jgi:CheY-like chemotaxis protein
MPYKNILLIDDDQDDQEIFLLAIEKIDPSIRCSVLSNATDAMDMLNAGNIHPDFIFLDLNLPAMNGQQFLEGIKKEEMIKDIPVVVLSTSSQKSTIELCRQMGAVDFISKPDNFNDLILNLRKILE